MPSIEYAYTNKWFEGSRGIWDILIPQINPTTILEVGSYEGASACYLIEKLSPHKAIEIHCVDTWDGGIEHKQGGFAFADMSEVEQRFHRNTQLAIQTAKAHVELKIHKGLSSLELSKLIAAGRKDYFDLIYIDGSHQAPDVLCDAVFCFQLLKTNGFMIFDDYLWHEPVPSGIDPIRCPKLAIDAFTNIFCRKIQLIQAPLYQLYLQKLSN
jgi:predicted O-methyltransferase YrrM